MINQQPSPNTGFQFNIDYKKLLFDVRRFWWLIVLSLAISVTAVVMSHRYAVPIYRASMSLIMEERGTDMPQSNMMEGFGLTPGQRSVENQIALLSSYDMARKAIDELDFNISYFVKGTIKETELYENTPFIVSFDSLHPQLLHVPFYITIIDRHRFTLEFEIEKSAPTYIYKTNNYGPVMGTIKYSETHLFNQPVKSDWFSFSLTNNIADRSEPRGYYYLFNHPDAMANAFRSGFVAIRTGETSSIVRMSVTGPNTSKNVRFLNKLSDVFIQSNLDKKNQIAENAIYFIEKQLINISDSLKTTGTLLSRFRADNKIQSINAQTTMLFTQLQEIDNVINNKQLQIDYYSYLTQYFTNESLPNEALAPALYPSDNATLSQQIQQIIELNSERLAIKEYNNPYAKELLTKINVAKQTLLVALNSQTQILNQTIHRVKTEKAILEQNLYLLPETERQMLGIQRQYELNNEVYNFLMRKRSESQIQKASNTPDHQVLERAKPAGQVSPQASANYQKAILIGLILPLGFIVLKQLLNNKINSSEDIERITHLPIVGQIVHSNKPDVNVVAASPRSVVTETIRRVRSRIEFLTSGKASPIITVTSSMPGEGKTFCALNLAAIFAYSGKKTVLVGFDMRKPGLNKVLNLNNHDGLSNYLIGKASLEKITITMDQPNLWVIPSGPIPPNPAELIGSDNTSALFESLRANYDVIILDTPPMGIVSDPYLVARHADTVLFLTRQGYTIKEVFAHTIKNMQDEGIQHIGIILNDVDNNKSGYGYRYGYGYGYGYGHGYYEEA